MIHRDAPKNKLSALSKKADSFFIKQDGLSNYPHGLLIYPHTPSIYPHGLLNKSDGFLNYPSTRSNYPHGLLNYLPVIFNLTPVKLYFTGDFDQKGAIMKNETEKWSKGKLKRHITKDREEQWRPDTIKMLAKWIGFKNGQTVVDVGCGMGFLGYTYFKYFGKDGTYLGVDHSEALVKDAAEISSGWAQNGKAEFVHGDAYKLPYPDNSADVVMCQTLLMHLAEPEKAIAEMIRVCKRDGKVVCMEPDHLAFFCSPAYKPFAPDFEMFWLKAKIQYYLIQAHKMAGNGDNAIGLKIPVMLMNAGLADIDMRNNDRILLFDAPYYKNRTAEARTSIRNNARFYAKLESSPAEKTKYMKKIDKSFKDLEKVFLKGGGNIEDLIRFKELSLKQLESKKSESDEILEMLNNGTYYCNCGSMFLYITIGTKK